MDHLDRDALEREFVFRTVDDTESALTNFLLKEIGLFDVAAARLQKHLLVDDECFYHVVQVVAGVCGQSALLIQ